MLDQVEAKIEELKKQQREEYYKKKEADLEEWGLHTRKTGKKSTPVVVTDEEYEALIDASSGVGMPTRNAFARVLNIAALFIVVAGIIIGFVVANFHEEMSFPIFMGAVAAAVLFALIFLGIGEALRLLQQIADTQRIEAARRKPQITKEFPDEQPTTPQAFRVESIDDLPTHPYYTAPAQPQFVPAAEAESAQASAEAAAEALAEPAPAESVAAEETAQEPVDLPEPAAEPTPAAQTESEDGDDDLWD